MPKRKLENRTIEVLLLQPYKHYPKFSIIRVKPIFARNVLIPTGIATLVTPMVLNNYKQKIESAKKEKEELLSKYKDLLSKIRNDGGLIIKKKTNAEGLLYAQLSVSDIINNIKEKYGMELDKNLLKLKASKIKKIGEYKVLFVFDNYQDEIVVKIVSESEKEEKVDLKNNEDREENIDADEKN